MASTNVIEQFDCIYYDTTTDDYAALSLDEGEAQVLAKHPGALTYRLEIRFPRDARRILWAEAGSITPTDFQRACDKDKEALFDRLCDY